MLPAHPWLCLPPPRLLPFFIKESVTYVCCQRKIFGIINLDKGLEMGYPFPGNKIIWPLS